MSEHIEVSGEGEIDFRQLLLEIDDDVRAKRASGELPADFERELDTVFARFAPAGALGGDFQQLLARAEQQAFIDLLAPNESVRPGVPHAKRVVQKAVRWYVRYVVEQLSGFAHTATKLFRRLDERVASLEELRVSDADLAAARRASAASHDRDWDAHITAALTGVGGRVLHARCGDGALVRRLRDNGIDAYGVDATSDEVATGTASGELDLRPDDERDHLRSVAPGELAGAVLTGAVDTLPAAAQIETVDLIATSLAAGGVLVIVTSHPDAWARLRSPLEVDLAPGRPMRPETWRHLLDDRGFTDVTVTDGPRLGGLTPVPGGDESVAGINANLHLLNNLLFPPASSIITARRPPPLPVA